MAKRRRLDPTSPMDIALSRSSGLETKSARPSSPAPIAQVTGEAATMAAAQDALGAVEQARREGRLVVSIPIAEISREHLIRDRISSHPDDMDALMRSLQTHGQRTPIEVEALEPSADGTPRYGLISGWRRLAALHALEKTHVDALIRTPKDAGEAYVAKVEENEIRANLSYYERARIAALAAARGGFDDVEEALSALYGSASRAKRSKIRSFVSLYESLGEKLQFPEAIPERLGLKIAAALKEGQISTLKKALSSKAKTAEAEIKRLTAALSNPPKPSAAIKETLAPNLIMETKGTGKTRRVTLSGEGLTDEVLERLRQSLA